MSCSLFRVLFLKDDASFISHLVLDLVTPISSTTKFQKNFNCFSYTNCDVMNRNVILGKVSLKKKKWCRFPTTPVPHSPGTNFRFNELNQEVRHCPGHQGNYLEHPQCSVKSQNSGFLKKVIFSIFRDQKWLFSSLFGAKIFFGGYLTFFGLWNLVWVQSYF